MSGNWKVIEQLFCMFSFYVLRIYKELIGGKFLVFHLGDVDC